MHGRLKAKAGRFRQAYDETPKSVCFRFDPINRNGYVTVQQSPKMSFRSSTRATVSRLRTMPGSMERAESSSIRLRHEELIFTVDPGLRPCLVAHLRCVDVSEDGAREVSKPLAGLASPPVQSADRLAKTLYQDIRTNVAMRTPYCT
jgi:hypothetical protein